MCQVLLLFKLDSCNEELEQICFLGLLGPGVQPVLERSDVGSRGISARCNARGRVPRGSVEATHQVSTRAGLLSLTLGRKGWGGRCRGREREEIRHWPRVNSAGMRGIGGSGEGIEREGPYFSTCSICGRCYQYVRALSEGLNCQLIWLLLSMAAKYNCDDAGEREKKRVQPQRA